MKKLFNLTFGAITCCCILCTHPQPLEQYVLEGYAPMNIGDFRQFIVMPDSVTVQFEIIQKVLRSDGQLVYQENVSSGTGFDSIETTYCYNNGNFIINCDSLDTLHDTSGNLLVVNPYGESRFALPNPSEGFRWFQIETNTIRFQRRAKLIGYISTPIGSFENVFGFEFYSYATDSVPFMTVCHGENYGYLYTFMENKVDSFLSIPVYSRVAGVERGIRRPPKGPPVNPDTSGFFKRRLEVVRKHLYCFM